MRDPALRDALLAFGLEEAHVLQDRETSTVFLGSRNTELVVVKAQKDPVLVANAPYAVAAQQRAADAGLAPPPLPARNGEYVVRSDSRSFTASVYLGGRRPPSRAHPHRLGTLTGELHMALNRHEPPMGSRSLPDIVSPEEAGSFPYAHGLEHDRAVRLSILERRRPLAAATNDQGTLHGDLWLGNLIRLGDRWQVIDFDRAATGPVGYEVIRCFLASSDAHVEPLGHVIDDLQAYFGAYVSVAGHLLAGQSFDDLLRTYASIGASDFSGLAPDATERRRSYARLVTQRLSWIDRHWMAVTEWIQD